jgi:hypothetical protein
VTSGTGSLPAVLSRSPHGCLLIGLMALIVSIFSCPTSAHSQDLRGPSSLSSSLRGTVTNSATREPVPRALVHSPDNRFATFTDDHGRFEFNFPRTESKTTNPTNEQGFDNRPPQLMARKPGFLGEGNGVSYQAQNAATDDINISLIPESLIVGRVSLPSSNQADRITVQVYRRQVTEGRARWVPAGSARTRSNGEFRIADLSAGTYKLFTDEMLDHDPITFDPRGQLSGYPPIFYPTAPDFASASPIILEAGKTFHAELSPVLQPYYSVKIAVTNMQVEGGLQVSVAHHGPGYSLAYAGNQKIEGMLPNGTYTVEATLQGQQSASGSVNIMVKGAPLTNANLALIPNGSIPVNIKEDLSASTGHDPARVFRTGKFSREQKANVYLQPVDDFNWPGGGWARQARQTKDNDLVLENVEPDRYWVNVNAFRGYVASAVAGGIDLLRQPLAVGPGGASAPIEIVLRDDTAAIEGTVDGMPTPPRSARNSATVAFATYTGPSPTPQGPWIYCVPLPDSPGRFTESWMSPEGTFQIQQLPPGAYRVLAFDHPQLELEYQNPEAMRIYEGKGSVVRLVPGQTERLRLTLISTQE